MAMCYAGAVVVTCCTASYSGEALAVRWESSELKVPPTSYAMPGTAIRRATTTLRACYAVSESTPLCAYAVRGTHVAYGVP
eukprot:471651-Rhodomonas_salina.1